MFLLLITSASHDPVTKLCNGRPRAEREMRDRLVREGWPVAEAEAAARRGSPVALADRGDDDTIQIRELRPVD